MALLRLSPATHPAEEPTRLWGSPEEVYRRYCYLVLTHRYLYYVMNRPALQDYEYDLMERFLVHLEKTTGVFHDQSPVRIVGSSQVAGYPKTSVTWADKILAGDVPRSVYFIEYLLQEDWKNYLNALPLER